MQLLNGRLQLVLEHSAEVSKDASPIDVLSDGIYLDGLEVLLSLLLKRELFTLCLSLGNLLFVLLGNGLLLLIERTILLQVVAHRGEGFPVDIIKLLVVLLCSEVSSLIEGVGLSGGKGCLFTSFLILLLELGFLLINLGFALGIVVLDFSKLLLRAFLHLRYIGVDIFLLQLLQILIQFFLGLLPVFC